MSSDRVHSSLIPIGPISVHRKRPTNTVNLASWNWHVLTQNSIFLSNVPYKISRSSRSLTRSNRLKTKRKSAKTVLIHFFRKELRVLCCVKYHSFRISHIHRFDRCCRHRWRRSKEIIQYFLYRYTCTTLEWPQTLTTHVFKLNLYIDVLSLLNTECLYKELLYEIEIQVRSRECKIGSREFWRHGFSF